MSRDNIYTLGLDKNPANYVPLSPLTFIERAAHVFPDYLALVHGDIRHTWGESYARSRRLASALQKRGIGPGDTVSIMGFNTPAMFEAHFGVPMTGAVLNTLNTRLDATTIGFMLRHAETRVLLTDRECSAIVRPALDQLDARPIVIDIDDPLADGGERLGDSDYEDFIADGDPEFQWHLPQDEWTAISLNYTSGTTGNPKGVVYHHRGAYLNAVSNVLGWELPKHCIYLWTLPMFHCNGWCFPWTLAAVAGVNVCLRKVRAEDIYTLIAREQVTHYCGAPIVHNMLANAPDNLKQKKSHRVRGLVAAAPPPAAVLQAMEENGFDITHVYGLTETYGPAVQCEWKSRWDELPIEQKAQMKSRQGVRYHMLEKLIVANPKTLEEVPHDGETIGEALFRGNNVMMGYLKNPEATAEAFRGGWFHSGDLGVMNPDGYLQLKDRSKDIIISGGENISTIEVESVLYRHPAVMEAAVVGRPDAKWGETPCAFVTVKPDADPVTESELIEFCRDHMAHYKAPKTIILGDLPKTSTGKVQKFKLRERAKSL